MSKNLQVIKRKNIFHPEIYQKNIDIYFIQIEKSLNFINLEFHSDQFVYKTFLMKLKCQQNLLKKIENEIITNESILNNFSDLDIKTKKINHTLEKLYFKLEEINKVNKFCSFVVTDIHKVQSIFSKDYDFLKKLNVNIYDSKQLYTIIKDKRSDLVLIQKIYNTICDNFKEIKQSPFVEKLFKEKVNETIFNFKNEITFMSKLLVKLTETYQEKKKQEFIKKSQTFSNLSINELKQISSELWMPNKVLNKNDETKSDYLSATSCSKKIKSDSWYTINKISNIIDYVPQSKIKDDRITSQYKELIGWNEQYCVPCKVYNKYKTVECIEKMLVDFTNNPHMDKINNEEIKIKDTKEKFNTLKKNFKNEKQIKEVKFDESKNPCKYVVVTKLNKVIYGRHCGNICEDNIDFCKDHKNKNKVEYSEIAENLCQHIITQKSGGKNGNPVVDQKGMTCNDFTFGAYNNKYCKIHEKSHKTAELLNKHTELRTFKIRVYPTFEQRKTVEKFFGSARKTYNMCIENNIYDKMKEEEARKKFVTDVDKLDKNYKFLKEIPKDVRAFEVAEYYKNKKNALDMYDKKVKNEEWKNEHLFKYKHKNVKEPEFSFKMKNDDQCINIIKGAINTKDNKIEFYKNKLGKDGFKIKDRLIKKDDKLMKLFKTGINHDMRLIKNTLNKYYLCISTDNEIIDKKEEGKVVTLDVGVRTPFVSFSEKECYEFGEHMNNELRKMIDEQEKLRRIYGAEIKKKKNGIENVENFKKSKRNYLTYIEKVKNRINDFHNKVITKLVKEYSVIMIPKLNTQKIMEDEKTHKTTKKMLSMLSHSTFLKRLKNKCEEKGVTLKIVNEDMTTQICGNCFSTYKFREEIYKCTKCSLVIGRDINSARNIYIKEIGKMVEFTKYIRKNL